RGSHHDPGRDRHLRREKQTSRVTDIKMTIRVRVQPRAKRNALSGLTEDEWKLHLTAPAIEGRGNQACIEFFARGLGIPRSRVKLLSGEKSRHKIIALEGVSEAEFLRFALQDRSNPS